MGNSNKVLPRDNQYRVDFVGDIPSLARSYRSPPTWDGYFMLLAAVIAGDDPQRHQTLRTTPPPAADERRWSSAGNDWWQRHGVALCAAAWTIADPMLRVTVRVALSYVNHHHPHPDALLLPGGRDVWRGNAPVVWPNQPDALVVWDPYEPDGRHMHWVDKNPFDWYRPRPTQQVVYIAMPLEVHGDDDVPVAALLKLRNILAVILDRLDGAATLDTVALCVCRAAGGCASLVERIRRDVMPDPVVHRVVREIHLLDVTAGVTTVLRLAEHSARSYRVPEDSPWAPEPDYLDAAVADIVQRDLVDPQTVRPGFLVHGLAADRTEDDTCRVQSPAAFQSIHRNLAHRLHVPVIQLDLTLHSLAYHRQWLWQRLGSLLDPEQHTSQLQVVVGVAVYWYNPKRTHCSHIVLLHLDYQHREWSVFDPNGGRMDVVIPSDGGDMTMLGTSSYELIQQLGPDLPTVTGGCLRYRLDRGAKGLNVQRAFELHTGLRPDLVCRVCPRGNCTMVAWLVCVLCQRLQYFDLHRVGEALSRLLLAWYRTNHATYEHHRMALLGWQNRLANLKTNEAVLRHLGFLRTNEAATTTGRRCNVYNPVTEQLCREAACTTPHPWAFCAEHVRSVVGGVGCGSTPPDNHTKPLLGGTCPVLQPPTAAMVEWAQSRVFVVSLAAPLSCRWTEVDREAEAAHHPGHVGVHVIGDQYDPAVAAEVEQHVEPLGLVATVVWVQLDMCHFQAVPVAQSGNVHYRIGVAVGDLSLDWLLMEDRRHGGDVAQLLGIPHGGGAGLTGPPPPVVAS